MLAIHLLTIWTILASVFLAFFSLLYRESEMNLTSNIRTCIYSVSTLSNPRYSRSTTTNFSLTIIFRFLRKDEEKDVRDSGAEQREKIAKRS